MRYNDSTGEALSITLEQLRPDASTLTLYHENNWQKLEGLIATVLGQRDRLISMCQKMILNDELDRDVFEDVIGQPRTQAQ